VLDLGQAQRLEHRRDVVPEPAPQALLEAVPASDGIVGRSSPRLDGPCLGRFLLVGVPERHPVAELGQHRVQVLDARQVVPQLGLADLHHERGRVGFGIAVGLELAATGRGS